MTANDLKHAQFAGSPADDGEVFEVFQQDLKDPAPYHGGNLLAPDTDLALHYAKEFYGRRQESHTLWIVPRSALAEVSEPSHLPLSLHALPHGQPPDLCTTPLPALDGQIPQEQLRQSFAIFVQKQAGKPLIWQQDLEEGSLLAAAESAVRALRANKEGCLRLWLCARSTIVELTDPDLLQPPLDRSYRRLDGYNIREKLRAARQRVQAQTQRGEQ